MLKKCNKLYKMSVFVVVFLQNVSFKASQLSKCKVFTI